jgi:hypothetical protein
MNSPARVPTEPPNVQPPASGGTTVARPAAGGAENPCPHCGSSPGQLPSAAAAAWVYAIGRIVPQFPDLGVEKEFAQLGAGAPAAGGTLETNRLIDALKKEGAEYLARQLCWVFHNGEAESFILVCRDDAQAQRLVDALPRAEQADQTIQVVIGSMGYPPASMAYPSTDACAGAALPAVVIDQHLTFPMSHFIDSLVAAEQGGVERDGKGKGGKADDGFRAVAQDLFSRLTRRSDNRGLTDEHRAVNYLALRYPPLYRLVAEAQRDDKALLEVQVRRGPSGSRRLVAVRPIFRSRRTEVVERYQCLVDVTDRFPFLAAPLTSVYD